MFEYFREPLRVRHEHTLITEFLEEYLFFHYTGEIRYHNYLFPLLVYKLLSRCTVAYYKFWREFDRSCPLIGPARVSTKFMKRYRSLYTPFIDSTSSYVREWPLKFRSIDR